MIFNVFALDLKDLLVKSKPESVEISSLKSLKPSLKPNSSK
jgi:hypothetical protein